AAAATPGELVQVAWAEATEALGLAGATHRPADTLDEHARRAAAALSLPDPAAAALADLARDTAAASYGRAAVAPEVAVRAARSVAMVETALRASASAPQRLRRALDPRPLLAPTAGGWRPGRRRAPSRAA
ncbi:MAG: hypothetical protein M3N68_07470, partial [Actinomycetota bacterium]|nr:hypothetical protein [Actinomycetota bacterium]